MVVEVSAEGANKVEVTAAVVTAAPASAARDIQLPSEFRSVVLTAIFAILLMCALYLARAVIVPVLLALVLRLFLQLPLGFLLRQGIPRIVAVFIVMIGFLGAFGLLGSTLAGPAADWVSNAPTNFSHMKDRIAVIKAPLDRLQSSARRIESLVVATPSNARTVTVAGPSLGGFVFANTQSLVRGLGTVIILLFFLLAAGDTFKRRLVEIMPRLSDKKQAVEIVNEIEDSISGYLLTITLINAGLGALTGAAFYLCGMPAPALWGAIAFSFNYVPFLGPLSAMAIFTLAGLFTFDTWHAFLPVGIYIALVIVEGQFVTPTILARRFALNPVAVIVSIIFWFWMWGTPGALLAFPMLAAFKILCDHVGPLNAIGHFLEG